MDLTLPEFAAIAEILGLVALVPSLIFVGVQLKRGNREARAATMQAAMVSDLTISIAFADHAGTWNKVITGQPLETGEESRRGIVLFNVLMADTEGRFHQYKAGYLDAQSWEGRSSALPGVTRLPIFEIWRNSPGGKSHAADFLALLDSYRAQADEEVSSDASGS
ncbi:MAG TPA: hypothetical protein VIV14_01965 [Gammaproteobacteria bacterium]